MKLDKRLIFKNAASGFVTLDVPNPEFANLPDSFDPLNPTTHAVISSTSSLGWWSKAPVRKPKSAPVEDFTRNVMPTPFDDDLFGGTGVKPDKEEETADVPSAPSVAEDTIPAGVQDYPDEWFVEGTQYDGAHFMLSRTGFLVLKENLATVYALSHYAKLEHPRYTHEQQREYYIKVLTGELDRRYKTVEDRIARLRKELATSEAQIVAFAPMDADVSIATEPRIAVNVPEPAPKKPVVPKKPKLVKPADDLDTAIEREQSGPVVVQQKEPVVPEVKKDAPVPKPLTTAGTLQDIIKQGQKSSVLQKPQAPSNAAADALKDILKGKR